MQSDTNVLNGTDFMTIGSKLQMLRRRKLLTRSKLAMLSGFNENTLRSWEQNKRRISPENLIKIIKVFEDNGTSVDLEWFYKESQKSLEPTSCISKHVIFQNSIYKLAYKNVEEMLQTKNNRPTLEEVNLAILEEYKKIFFELNSQQEEE